MKIYLLFFLISLSTVQCQIQWQPGDWAMACDFKANDLKSSLVKGELCSTECVETYGCTHYVWTNYNGGTCWMKSGKVSKLDAIFNGNYQTSCGLVNDGNPPEPPSPLGKLLWSDEFNYNGKATALWHYEIGNGNWGWGNDEKQYYTDSNANVKDGFLTIVSKRENFNGFGYTSARLITKTEFRYGVFVMRAKLPRGRGLMSAFWMLGTDTSRGPWPNVGEIDIMENPGFEVDRIFATIHCKAYNHMNHNPKGSNRLVKNLYDNFHTYKLDWNSKRIIWYVDDQRYFEYQNDNKGNKDTWPYDSPMKVIINLSIGGKWEGSKGIDNNIFPAHFVIDYIRQYAPTN